MKISEALAFALGSALVVAGFVLSFVWLLGHASGAGYTNFTK